MTSAEYHEKYSELCARIRNLTETIESALLERENLRDRLADLQFNYLLDTEEDRC